MAEPTWNSKRLTPESKVLVYVQYSIETKILQLKYRETKLAHYDYYDVPAELAQGAFVVERVEEWLHQVFLPAKLAYRKKEYEVAS